MTGRLKLLLLILLLPLVASCAPVQDGVERAVRAVGADGDPATLTIYPDGVVFDSGPTVALQVVLYVGGENLQEAEEVCEPLGNGIVCELGDVVGPVTMDVTGTDRSSNVSYYRESDSSPRFFYVRE